MSGVDWEEVKRLAADFQKAQLSSTLQKFSERNCIEIISTLVENKLLDIIFTNDGKEYVTPQHLRKEIKDELYIHGGKISLVELVQILNINLSQITKAVTELEKHNKGLKVILGQLIDKSYINKIAEEINDKLVQYGCINVAELTLTYNLPSDFLQSVIEKELGKIIHATQDSQDRKIFYTESFIARNKAKIKGALSAITKPTPLSAILGQCGVLERIFFSILDSLQEVKQVPGIVTGKQSGNSIYIPTIYSKSQNEWVENFYKQNGYLEYDALTRLGISDPSGFIKRHFPNENMVFLKSVAVGTVITDQVDANIEEVVATGSFIDLCPLLPSVFSDEDVELIIKLATKKIRVNVHTFAKTVIVSETFLQALTKSLETVSKQKAHDIVASGKWIQSITENKLKSKSADLIVDSKVTKKEERRKKAAIGKTGGGSQGRETKTKSTKKKYLQAKMQENDSDENETRQTAVGKDEITLITMEEVKTKIMKDDNIIEEMANELACYLQPKLNKSALTLAEQLAQSNKTTNLSEIGERLNILITNIRIFDKGIKHLHKADQAPLTKYLLKSLGLDFVTSIFKLVAQQNMLQVAQNLTTETRQRLLLELPADVKEPLTVIHKTIMGDSVEDFLNNVDRAMAACCLVLKKYDKKKDRLQIYAHREALLEELNATQDPALTLHLVTSVLFTAVTQNALHMSGRHVTTVLAFLQEQLEPNTMLALSRYHDLVLNLLSTSDENTKMEAFKTLEEGLIDIKNIANNFKHHVKMDKS
ncbi:PREDICTED: E3 UFM1-protein ligase 1 homolog [Cyphomyrmex costatus]|uniref:E3 UFM1-protein ligase 1 homolog n=1 Tax=Cyphomyrmex costatus TaxID=456900 RepID=A0A151IF33_9HYME|nr:PREDICTED: E3 UFM1-protein ligase 1 homolog [Cyphomyrmex costatus]KYM99511.1 E3 UFM1-protein ligase 1 like protein [Cyphomyrmex costatus]